MSILASLIYFSCFLRTSNQDSILAGTTGGEGNCGTKTLQPFCSSSCFSHGNQFSSGYPSVPWKINTLFIDIHILSFCYIVRQCYTTIHHVFIYEFSRQIFSERNGSDSRLHSSPDPSCGRAISPGKTKNPIPPKKEL